MRLVTLGNMPNERSGFGVISNANEAIAKCSATFLVGSRKLRVTVAAMLLGRAVESALCEGCPDLVPGDCWNPAHHAALSKVSHSKAISVSRLAFWRAV
jgi:hypothetical protein